jgi:NAD(P)-dependent dehydrogenase (short-subunit alcohol dehydrogenase family)
MPHPAMAKDNVAVITGGASGIGLAAGMRFATDGMKVCIADIGDEALKAAEAKLSAASPRGGASVMAVKVDVSSRDELAALEAAVQKRFGGTDILMNNAGISPGAKMFGPLEN